MAILFELSFSGSALNKVTSFIHHCSRSAREFNKTKKFFNNKKLKTYHWN